MASVRGKGARSARFDRARIVGALVRRVNARQ